MKTAKTKMFVGSSGFGKSWIQGWDLEQYFAKGFFPVMLDKKRDHEQLADYLGFKKIKVGDKSIDAFSADKWREIIINARQNGYSGIWITFDKANPNIQTEDLRDFCNTICYAVLSIDFKIYLILEEIRNYAPSQSDDKKFDALKTVIVEGRSMDKIFGATCQFPQQVHHKVFQAVNIYYVFGLGIDDNKYSKLSIKGKRREDMKNWDKDERKYLHIDENSGIKEVKSSKGISRQTPHSG